MLLALPVLLPALLLVSWVMLVYEERRNNPDFSLAWCVWFAYIICLRVSNDTVEWQILILIFAEVLGLYGLIVALIMTSNVGNVTVSRFDDMLYLYTHADILLSVLKLSTSTEQDKGRFDERFSRLVLIVSVHGFSLVTLCCGLRACLYPLIGGSLTVSFVSQMIECRNLLTPTTVLLTFQFFPCTQKVLGLILRHCLYSSSFPRGTYNFNTHIQIASSRQQLTRATREA